MDRMHQIVPSLQRNFRKWKKDNSHKTLQKDIKVSQLLGMRNITAMICETSRLEPTDGIRFREHRIKSVVRDLPKTPHFPKKAPIGVLQPLPEGVLWLLLTGEIPSSSTVEQISQDLLSRANLPQETERLIDSLPKSMHPMVQLSTAMLSMSMESVFRKAFFERKPKNEMWKYTLEDGLNIIARVGTAASRIYRNVYGVERAERRKSVDWTSKFCADIGQDSFEFWELMRLYFTIHSDHEAGNVSSHACHLVNSAMSDPYLAFSAGINGLAGPLHGLANQEVLQWIRKLDKELEGKSLTIENVSKYAQDCLSSGNVIPGFGHAVLRVTDPRYICQQHFAKSYLDGDHRLYKIVKMLYEVVPGILSGLGKVSNPYPNVDGHSGVLLDYFGLKEAEFYTVLFAVSRSIGTMASLTISRAYGLPIERPKSITTQWISENIQ